ALWIGGVFVFAAYVNWSINARSILPMTPPACAFAARRLPNLHVRIGIAFAALVTLVVAVSDYSLAGASRYAAQQIRARTRNSDRTVWFTGHWGFQYYMQDFARPWDNSSTRCENGDWIVIYL